MSEAMLHPADVAAPTVVAGHAAERSGAPHSLEIEGAWLHYGAAEALRGVSLQASAGAITAVIGRNGVGKTSLVRAIAGHHPLSRGTVSLFGRPAKGMASYARARLGLGLVPQGREVFPLLTVAENLASGLSAVPKGEPRAVPDEVHELFPVLGSMMNRRGGDLSGGQQQQLAIGRALVGRPRLLVLDEPTEGIQPSIIKDIGRALVALKEQGLAILLIEQYLDFVRELADTVHVLERGAIAHSGPALILDDERVRAALTV